MGCEHLNLGNGVTAIVCTRGTRAAKCSSCKHARAVLMCDWKLKGKKAGKTCDRKLCGGCAVEVGPEKHLCPAHARAWEKHPAYKARLK